MPWDALGETRNGRQEMTTAVSSISKIPEPLPRPSDPAWRWNGHFWERSLAKGFSAVIHYSPQIDSGYPYRGVVSHGFTMDAPRRETVDEAADDTIRMAECVGKFEREQITVLVRPQRGRRRQQTL